MALSKVDLANQVENQLPQNLVANNLPFRNIIINGDMSIAQRGTSVAGLQNSGGVYLIDRFSYRRDGTWTTAEFTMTQSTDVPTGQGFATSLKMDCTTAEASPPSTVYAAINQKFEGQNLQYLKKGTANAVPLTLSFWVKSNKTGTYIAEIDDDTNSRNINKSYTVDLADTWEKKTITFEGDTSGTLNNTNAESLNVNFFLGAGTNFTSGTLATTWESTTNANRAVGQVNLADDTANEWYITGVQLEAGTTASDFEFLPVDVNLARCQRYYIKIAEGASQPIHMAMSYNSTQASAIILLPNPMRTTPSIDQTSGTNYYRYVSNATNTNFNSLTFDFGTGNQALGIRTTSISGLTGGNAGWFQLINASSYLAFSSEL
jgi:hypothetical protein